MKPARSFSSNIDPRIVFRALALSAAALAVALAVGPDAPAAAGGSVPASRTDPAVPEDQARRGSVAVLLEGSWRAEDGSMIFFGPIDAKTGLGRYEAAGPGASADRHRHRYRVTKSDEAARKAEIEIIFDDPRALPAAQELTLSADGRSAERRLLGGGPMFLWMVRLDPRFSDTLTHVSNQPF